MLTEVGLRNFKCFEKMDVSDLKNINILHGKNNSGKSSVLQAINFLKTSIKHKQLIWDKETLGFSLHSFSETVFGHNEDSDITIECTFTLNDEEKTKSESMVKELELPLSLHLKKNRKVKCRVHQFMS